MQHIRLEAHNLVQLESIFDAVTSGHILAPMAETFGVDPEPNIEIMEGHFRRASQGTKTYRGQRHTFFGRQDKEVKFGKEVMYQATHDLNYGYGEEGTIDYLTAIFYSIWLRGYDPVYVPFGRPAPRDCNEFKKGLDPSNAYKLPDEFNELMQATEEPTETTKVAAPKQLELPISQAEVISQLTKMHKAKSDQGARRSMTHWAKKHGLDIPELAGRQEAIDYLEGVLR